MIQIFLKHFEKLLKDKYAISFEYDNKSLIMKYFNKDIDEIKEDLKNIKNHILK